MQRSRSTGGEPYSPLRHISAQFFGDVQRLGCPAAATRPRPIRSSAPPPSSPRKTCRRAATCATALAIASSRSSLVARSLVYHPDQHALMSSLLGPQEGARAHTRPPLVGEENDVSVQSHNPRATAGTAS